MNIQWESIWKDLGWPIILALCNAARIVAAVGGAVSLFMVAKNYLDAPDKDQEKGDTIKKIFVIIVLFFLLWNLKTVLNFFGISEASFNVVE